MGLYLRPTRLDAALATLAERPATILAGGTDHYPARVIHAPDETILDITALPGLRAIENRGDHWFVPCLATWTDIVRAGLPPMFDGLRAAARQIGGVQVQNVATIAGNVCNASPAADGIPCLLALGAAVDLASAAHRRTLPLEDFLLGPRATARHQDELVLGLRIPAHAADTRATFEKLGARRYLVISIAMIAVVAQFRDDGAVASARVSVGACSPCAVRLPALEAAMAGRLPDPATVQPDHLAPLSPIADIRATAGYRQSAALELVRRAIAGLSQRQSLAA